jgi:RNA binding exosome subunit
MVKVVVELSTFIHSTENEGKVLEALTKALPESLRSTLSQKINLEKLEGHYGNIIKVVRLSVGREHGVDVLRHILCSMGRTNRDILLATLENRVEERRSRLHIRLSKQDLYLGRVVLSDSSDVVKVVASFEGAHHLDLEKVLSDLGETCAS